MVGRGRCLVVRASEKRQATGKQQASTRRIWGRSEEERREKAFSRREFLGLSISRLEANLASNTRTIAILDDNRLH